MLHRLNFITRFVMLVVAGTLVFVVTTRDEPAAASGEAHAPETKSRASDAGHSRARPESRPTRPDAAGGRRAFVPSPAVTGVRLPEAGRLRSDLKVEIDRPHGDLEERAQRVESFALRRLGVLTAELNLTAEQQARIFPILARGAQSYDPRMRIVTGSQARPLAPAEDSPPIDKSQEQELVQKELNPAQSDELVDQSIRDLLIWEEIIDGLAIQLDQATPGQIDETTNSGMSDVPAAEAPAQDVPAPATEPTVPLESHGGRNLFDLLAPGN